MSDSLQRLAMVVERFRDLDPDAFLAAYATDDGGIEGVTYGDIATLGAQLTYIMRVLRAFVMYPNDCMDMLMWRCDGTWAPLTLMVNCSDFFHWATADCVEIAPDDLDTLEQAFADVKAADADLYWGASLFAARKRGMRPQRPVYRQMDAALAALFDACGPERGSGQ